MKGTTLKCVLGLAAMAATLGFAQSPPQDAPKPDNTAVNQRDRDKSQPTADQQKENPSDRETVRKIRQALVKDKSLSSYAHNIKVIAQGGSVTLKGPVRSEEEKQNIEQKAAEIAGKDNVKSQLQVATKHDKHADESSAAH
ncbi:Putative phosphoslipid binding protein [Candidatus Koribacter versatilis Ellin345]|uniref:Phosphoslipid binding protein n=1 Tax=Koribacter versatilis (strain Ellin345) TaxID=204669 RepID=Q1ISM8_KORVE|nr:BON domain-containing protein [Candidatus Koribacter versatilis]ABF40122.1 Putative phosphoslipid binding protein [Candidatus Koribacter versatilis Ellin345]